MVGHVTSASAQVLGELPTWVRLVRAPNPGPMTLDGTNTWVLRPPGAAKCVVVDPGPLDEGHLAAVSAEAPVAVILTTHGHPDHVEGLGRFRELHPSAAMLAARDGVSVIAEAMHIRVLGTPGHTSDSVSFVVAFEGETVAFTGDTILGRGTTVVAYPDGDLGQYLDSLRRIEELGAIPVLPGHGPALADCATAAAFYLRHRLARLDQVRAAIAGGAATAQDVVRLVYADVDRALWPAAELSVRAQLAFLESGREADRESARAPSRLDPP